MKSHVQYGYSNNAWGDVLTSYGDTTVRADEAGNTLELGDYEYVWHRGKLLGAVTSDDVISYDYDADGIRTVKVVSGVEHRYVTLGSQLISEIFGAEIVTYFYDASGRPIGMRYMNTDDSFALEHYFYFERNIFGDIVAVYDEDYNKILSYSYDAWGNFTTTVHTTDTEKAYKAQCNSLTYRGYYYDEETNLYYLQTRYYSPELCRFISADSVDYLDPESITGLNLFAYCGNDPINNYDPTGHFSLPNWAKWVIGGVAFAGAVALTALTGGALAPMFIQFGASIVLGGLIQGTVNAIQGENFWEGFADGAASGALTGGVLALGQSIFRVIKVANYASKGLTIGKKGAFEQVGQMTGTAHYGGLKSHGFLSKMFGRNFADKVGWIQNKSIVQGVMKFKGVIYDCGGELTGAYAKEIALTKGYQYFVNIWLL